MKNVKRAVGIILCAAILAVSLLSLPVGAVSRRARIEAGVNIRKAPGTWNAAVYTTPEETEAFYLGEERDSDGDRWYHIRTFGGIEGYVFNTLAELYSVPEGPEFNTENRVMLISGGINVREKPTTDSTAIATLWACSLESKGKTVNSRGETWYNIVTPGGLNGYIRSDFIAEYTYNYDAEFEKTLSAFPKNYRDGLRYLHTKYPNWKFKADVLDITFDYAVSKESGRKMLHNVYTSLPESWRTSEVGEPGYRIASEEALRYFMAPENFIVPDAIFMFMQQSYDAAIHTENGVKSIVKGTFLERSDYVGYIMKAARESLVNPYVLAGTILQEQGTSGSALSGGPYKGFEGYYNFFNFGASGSTTAEIIENGLMFAKRSGWDSPEKSIVEGAKMYVDGYVNDRQDTYYYKNFNVICKTWGHQYATNIHDSLNNAEYLADAFDGSAEIVFRLPVYLGSDMGEHTHAADVWKSDAVNHWKECAECGEKFSLAEHEFNGGVVTKPPEVGKKGIKTYTCETCGYTKTEEIEELPPLGNKRGDANGDGKINIVDLALIRKHLLGKGSIDDKNFSGADINGNGKIDITDLALLRKHLLGKINLEEQ